MGRRSWRQTAAESHSRRRGEDVVGRREWTPDESVTFKYYCVEFPPSLIVRRVMEACWGAGGLSVSQDFDLRSPGSFATFGTHYTANPRNPSSYKKQNWGDLKKKSPGFFPQTPPRTPLPPPSCLPPPPISR